MQGDAAADVVVVGDGGGYRQAERAMLAQQRSRERGALLPDGLSLGASAVCINQNVAPTVLLLGWPRVWHKLRLILLLNLVSFMLPWVFNIGEKQPSQHLFCLPCNLHTAYVCS